MDYFFIGEAELVTAFRFAGVGGEAAGNRDEALTAFRTLTGAGVKSAVQAGSATGAQAITAKSGQAGEQTAKIVILTEQAADWIGDELTEWQLSGKYPLVVEVPGLAGRVSGRKTLVDSIREAIGIHV
jgi:V/A-type H+-transporting ATPase subunit F